MSKSAWTEENFRTLAENCPDVIDRFDRNSRHIYVNAAGLRQLSLPADKVIGRTIRETGVAEPFCELWEERVFHVLKTAKPLEVSDAFPGPNGLTYFNSLCVPEFDDAGEVRSVLVISRDITEHKKREDALRRSEADLAEAQRMAKLGNWSRDLATNRIRWTHELFRMFGVAEENGPLSFDLLLERVHPDDRERVAQATKTTAATGKPFEIEFRTLTQSGEIRYLRALGYARKNKDHVAVELFGTAQDISESKRAEEALRKLNEDLENRVRQRTAKLRELALELTQAEQKERKRISEVLHEDIQQQLVALRFRLEQIRQREGASQTGAELDWVLENLRNTSVQLRHLTARLRPPALYDCGLKPAILWLATDIEARFGFTVEVEGDDLPEIVSEEINEFAFSAVSELLLNVVKHSGTKCARVVFSPPKDRAITLTVSDEGSGFDCASAAKKNTFGLFSIRERAQTLGGHLELTGEPGKGTRAALTIPVK